MLLIILLGLSVIVTAAMFWFMRRIGGSSVYLAISTLPLLLTVLVPLPFALATHGPTDWTRQATVSISKVGVTLSFILLVIGVALTLRAILARDHRAAGVLAVETVLAGIPAGTFAAYALLFRLS